MNLTIQGLAGESIYETPHVNLVSREVTADGVSINGETHLPYQYSEPTLFQAASEV
jgi:hypothetical protein